MKKSTLAVVVVCLFLPFWALAKIGVGVGTGKIVVDQPMKPGLIYTLPPLVVLNTGDEASDYGVTIQHRENQEQMKPAKEWFSFEPSSFYLNPGESKVVQIKLTLPIKGARPGDYFAFLQAYPKQKAGVSGTSVNIAAAAKLYFTIVPSNFFAGIYYRIVSLLTLYSPWGYIVLVVIGATLLLGILRRFISFNIGLSVKKK